MDANDIPDEERRKRIVNFMQFVNDIDASRRLSFKSIAPDIFDAVDSYVGGWNVGTRYA